MRALPIRRARGRGGLAADVRGVSAIEFAFAMPVLILLYVGAFQFCDAISAYRKVTIATRTVADLTSQYTSITNTELDTILALSAQVMAPYSVDPATATISQVSIDKDGNSKIAWSRSKNGTAHKVGDPFALDDTIKQPNTSLIVGEFSYEYTPSFAGKMIGKLTMSDHILMSPRRSVSIVLK